MNIVRKKALSMLLAFVMVLSLIPVFAPEAEAANDVDIDGIIAKIEELKEEFPDGTYWNHLVVNGLDGDTLLATRNSAYAYSVTNTPCATHNGRAGNTQIDCNYSGGGLQCGGFGCLIRQENFGMDRAALPRRYDKENIAVGDYVRFGTDQNGHSFVVIDREGDIVTVVECNFGGKASTNCQIKWGRKINLNESSYGLSFGYYIHADNYETVKNSGSSFVRPDSLYFGKDAYVYISSKLNDESEILLMANASTSTSQGVATTRWNYNLFDPRIIWRIQWDDKTSSYKITSEYDGRVLDVRNADDFASAAVQVYESNSTAAQRWRLVAASGNYFTMLPNSSSKGLVADITGGNTASNTPIQLWEANGTDAQLFAIRKLTISYKKPSRPGKPTGIQASTTNGTTTISWKAVATNGSFDKREYKVVVDGVSYTTKDTSITLPLSAGGHTIKVCALNTAYLDWASGYNSKTITVEQEYYDFSNEVISGWIPEPM